jgi:hypothetical protein
MMHRLRKRVREMDPHSDEGVSLLLAMIFVLFVGLIVTAVLPYTASGITAANAVADVRTTQNAVDGAMDQAINSIRKSFVLGTQKLCSNNAADTYTAPAYAPPTSDIQPVNVVVDYCNKPNAAGGTSTTPDFAIQTLRGGVTTDGNNTMLVAGGILSNADVSFSATGTGNTQSLNVDGDVYAKGTCSARNVFVVSGVEHCGNTTPAYSSSSDPDPTKDPLVNLVSPVNPWASNGTGSTFALNANGLPSSASATDPLGTCDVTNVASVVTFSPGFYSQSPQPDPTTCTGVKHTVWWFKPGDYYFDFPDSKFDDAAVNPTQFADSDAQFGVNGTLIIGGTPLNWAPGTASDDSAAITNLYKNDPDHNSPACDATKAGVDFAFGGPTNIDIGLQGTSGPDRLELCSAAVGTQSISLFGLRSSDAPNGVRSTTATAATSTVTAPVAVAFSPASGAVKINDGSTASVDLSGDGPNKLGSLVYSGFDVSAIPAGSLITKAQLHVKWTTTGNNPTSVTNTLTQVLPTTPSLFTAPAMGATGDVTVPLNLTGINDPVGWRALKTAISALSLKFTADGTSLTPTTVDKKGKTTPAQTATSSVDGVQLEVSYVPPALEPIRCAGSLTFPVTTPCNILTNKVDDTLFLHGTIYTPTSILEAAVHNYSSTVFERGVIADSLIAHLSSSAKQTLPPFQLPKGGKDRTVQFTAWTLKPDGTRDRKRLVVLVHYVDFIAMPGSKTLASPGHSVQVLKWTVLR